MVVAVKTFNGTGANTSGSSGDANRVLTLTNTQLTQQEGLLVYASGLALALTTEYTVSHLTSSTTITFLNGLWDDMTIVVKYYTTTAGGTGIIPLNQRFIQKELDKTANSCTIIEISKSYGTDEYRTVTETETTNIGISCWTNVVNEEDDIVKQGNARAGDMLFWFDSENESLCVQGNRITFDSKTYQIYDVHIFKATSDITYVIECRTRQI